jgi:hypothetical protein
MINNRELAEHLRRHITDLRWGTRGELFTKLTTNALQVWIEQFKIKDDANLLDPKPAMVMNRGATKNNIERSIQEIWCGRLSVPKNPREEKEDHEEVREDLQGTPEATIVLPTEETRPVPVVWRNHPGVQEETLARRVRSRVSVLSLSGRDQTGYPSERPYGLCSLWGVGSVLGSWSHSTPVWAERQVGPRCWSHILVSREPPDAVSVMSQREIIPRSHREGPLRWTGRRAGAEWTGIDRPGWHPGGRASRWTVEKEFQ